MIILLPPRKLGEGKRRKGDGGLHFATRLRLARRARVGSRGGKQQGCCRNDAHSPMDRSASCQSVGPQCESLPLAPRPTDCV
jgi:hypothetical protein